MGIKAVSDAGPIIHLTELDAIKAFSISKACTTNFVKEEVSSMNVSCPLPVKLVDFNAVTFYALKNELGLGESSCIALCLNEDLSLFFTDDLAARIVAGSEGIEVHGSIGIILRAFRDKIFSKEKTLNILQSIKSKSSLFITNKLVNDAIKAVEGY